MLTSLLSFLPFLTTAAFLLGGWYCGRSTTSVPLTKTLWLSRGILTFLLIGLPAYYSFANASETTNLLRNTALSHIMLGLVVVMGWVLLTFSRNYMAGQANQHRYARWFLFTLASVSITVSANHLILFWLGWVCISLSLHNLLTFYPDRPRAILAAHKKFILARTAELALLVAFVLLYQLHQSFYISDILNSISTQLHSKQTLSWQQQTVACLIALATLIKCAQLPFHGWLIQVVESPTPVSALLHAGVINLGGYMLLLFAPLVANSTLATWILLIVAGFSTLASALVMTTRISVKVRLAWSTSAQMGLMLMEFALGLYELVLLHLLAHSFYKAYAFLNSGNAVQEDLRLRLSSAMASSLNKQPRAFHGWRNWAFALSVSIVSVVLVKELFHYHSAVATWWLFNLALTTLILQWRTAEHAPSMLYTLTVAGTLTLLYGSLKTLSRQALPLADLPHPVAFSGMDLLAIGIFTLLFTLNALLYYQIHTSFMRRLSVALFAGLYLDEWLTRIVLKLWPVTLPTRMKDKQSSKTQSNNVSAHIKELL